MLSRTSHPFSDSQYNPNLWQSFPMRHALASLVLALFLFPSLSLGQTVKFNDLELRGGLYYKQSTDVLFTGKVTGRIQCSLKEGKLDGPFVEYHENGKVFEKGTYKDGKKEGPWVWYMPNGTFVPQISGTYEDGKKISD